MQNSKVYFKTEAVAGAKKYVCKFHFIEEMFRKNAFIGYREVKNHFLAIFQTFNYISYHNKPQKQNF